MPMGQWEEIDKNASIRVEWTNNMRQGAGPVEWQRDWYLLNIPF